MQNGASHVIFRMRPYPNWYGFVNHSHDHTHLGLSLSFASLKFAVFFSVFQFFFFEIFRKKLSHTTLTREAEAGQVGMAASGF